MIDPISATRPPSPGATAGPEARLRAAAAALEARFLAEMLGHAGLGESAGAAPGGIGEEQFASLLREAQAKAIVAQGGIGLAERIVRSLAARAGTEG